MYFDDYPTCAKTFAALRITGHTLDPDIVSAELGLPASLGWRRGDLPEGADGRQSTAYPEGAWMLSTPDELASDDLRRHIDWLLDAVESRRLVLDKLRSQGCRLL